MKIWMGYGSEHSMNLVLIGKFKQARDADGVEDLLNKLRDQSVKDEAYSISSDSPEDQRFSDEMLALLRANEIYTLGPADLEQFASDHRVDHKGDRITIKTDEADISAFIKIFLNAGARVEIYSAHDYSDEKSNNS